MTKHDKQLLGWLKTGLSKVHDGLEAGVSRAQTVAQKLNEKIEQNPKAKEAKSRMTDFGDRQVEKLKDIQIGHTRLGDLPNAAQRLTERQIYKMLHRLYEIDPNGQWAAFAPPPDQLPVFSAFETLGLPYGAPYEDVKKAYRQLMRAWHPDKHASSPQQEKASTQKAQEITAAYELITQHYGK
ncbi:MAG: J domain-containing protein [Proteobacteria bacterium]|nr:J domain-containing protein [Pseudomonadota bacterium]